MEGGNNNEENDNQQRIPQRVLLEQLLRMNVLGGNNAEEADDLDESENEEGGGNNNNNNNNNVMIEIDLDEDEEDGDNDLTYDGGVAVNPDSDESCKAKKHSSECDLVSVTTLVFHACATVQFLRTYFQRNSEHGKGNKTKQNKTKQYLTNCLHSIVFLLLSTLIHNVPLLNSFCTYTVKNQSMWPRNIPS